MKSKIQEHKNGIQNAVSKTTIKTLSLLVIAGAFLVTACKKKDDVIPDNPVTTTSGSTTGSTTGPVTGPTAVTPNLSDADGVYIATKLNTTTSIPNTTITVNTVIGNAVASLYSATGGTVLTDGGTVKANDSTLAKQSNNAYIFVPKSTGISYSSNSRWNISGNGTVPAFTYTAYGFPGTPSINNVTSVSKSASFTMTTNSISNADSVCFQITAGSKTIYKIRGGNQTSHTFSAAEMGTLDATANGFLTITGYKFNTNTVSGKK
ncbi:MAG: hypothetical protein O9353_03455, partial [Bacteroidia bacterium]|nr:hypothetical protein [Bacteroidia bacterium]